MPRGASHGMSRVERRPWGVTSSENDHEGKTDMRRRSESSADRVSIALAVAMVACLGAGPAAAQQAADDSAQKDLAQKLSNPVSDLVSMPFQFNWEANVGPSELTRFVLNVQPVMPFTISSDWNLIVRLIVPMISQPPLVTGGEATFGVGDVNAQFFLSP